MKKTTLSQKKLKNNNGKPNSKYAQKLARRKRLVARLGINDMPWPVLRLQDILDEGEK